MKSWSSRAWEDAAINSWQGERGGGRGCRRDGGEHQHAESGHGHECGHAAEQSIHTTDGEMRFPDIVRHSPELDWEAMTEPAGHGKQPLTHRHRY